MLIEMFLFAFINLIGLGLSKELEEYSNPTQVGELKAPLCNVGDVHPLPDRFCIFCRNEIGLYRLYERKSPFQLLTVIHEDDIKQQLESVYSEYSECFYILDGVNFATTSLKRVWKIRLQDHIATLFVSVSQGYSTMAASSDGGLFVASMNQNCDETLIVVYDSKGNPKNSGVIDRHSDMPYFLKTNFKKIASDERIHICELWEPFLVLSINGRSEFVPNTWMDVKPTSAMLNERKDEVNVIWTSSSHRLNISETLNENHTLLEADEKIWVRLLYAHWKISIVNCVLTYVRAQPLLSFYIICTDITDVLIRLNIDFSEFHLCSSTPERCRERMELLREDWKLSSCIVSAAMQRGQTGIVAIPKLKSWHCSVEIHNVR